MPEGVRTTLRLRVVKTFNAGNAEVSADLPHVISRWEVVAWQPGNPGSHALGSFTITLHPPGSPSYAAARADYDLLDYYQRIEAYDGGKLRFAGIVTGMRKVFGQGALFELTGASDLVLANLSRPFPGEFLPNDLTSNVLKSYLGTNELGASDTFNPFTAANYNSIAEPSRTIGTWTGTTDDNFPVVSCSTGTGAALISKTGAAANDRWHMQYVEVTGRLKPSADARNAGYVGIGLSKSPSNVNDAVQGYINAFLYQGRYSLDVAIVNYIGGVVSNTVFPSPAALLNVDDPQGYIPITLGLLLTLGGGATSTPSASFTVNGRTILANLFTGVDPGVATMYPFLKFGTPASGTATAYLTNLVQLTRFAADGPSTAAVFTPGAITAATHSLAYGADPGPSFLEAVSRLATRESWYLRYTAQPYVIGSRTLGTVDYGPDPGADLGTTRIVTFEEGDNLIALSMMANADNFATDTAAVGQATLDGGGIGFWRDIASMIKYGVLQDEALSLTHSDFNTLRRAAYQIVSNKINLSSAGSKMIIALRDAMTADKWRELDRVMIDNPTVGIYKLVARIIAYSFEEGSESQAITLDQFSGQVSGL